MRRTRPLSRSKKAIEKRDTDAFVSVTHPDFVAINAAGKEKIHGQEALRKGIAVVFAHATKSSQHSSVNNITFTKDGAIVEFVSETKFTIVENGKTKEIVESGTYRDLWVQKAGVWLEKRARAIEESFTIDGQEQDTSEL